MVRTYTVVVWVMISSAPVGLHQRFGGTYYLNRHGRRIMQRLLDYSKSEAKRSQEDRYKVVAKSIIYFRTFTNKKGEMVVSKSS